MFPNIFLSFLSVPFLSDHNLSQLSVFALFRHRCDISLSCFCMSVSKDRHRVNISQKNNKL